jgi:hypothetical protein
MPQPKLLAGSEALPCPISKRADTNFTSHESLAHVRALYTKPHIRIAARTGREPPSSCNLNLTIADDCCECAVKCAEVIPHPQVHNVVVCWVVAYTRLNKARIESRAVECFDKVILFATSTENLTNVSSDHLAKPFEPIPGVRNFRPQQANRAHELVFFSRLVMRGQVSEATGKCICPTSPGRAASARVAASPEPFAVQVSPSVREKGSPIAVSPCATRTASWEQQREEPILPVCI